MAASETPKAEKPTYHRDRLIAEAPEFFDEPRHVVQPALDAKRKSTFTREEAEKAIKEFHDRPVEMSYGTQTGIPDEMEEVA